MQNSKRDAVAERPQIYAGKNVLVTGATKGIGRAIAIEFGLHGAHTWLTHRWGTVPDAEVLEAFRAVGVEHAPRILLSDVANADDLADLMKTMKGECDGVHAFISNAVFSAKVSSMEEYKLRSFLRSMEYSAWPFVSYTQAIYETFGTYPKYVLGISSNGPDTYHQNYDIAALGKAVMETMAKYLSQRLWPFGTTVNVLRPWQLVTDSSVSIFGEEFIEIGSKLLPPGSLLTPQQVARSAFGMCSGYFDHMTGQTITVDGGGIFVDNTHGFLNRPELRNAVQKGFEK